MSHPNHQIPNISYLPKRLLRHREKSRRDRNGYNGVPRWKCFGQPIWTGIPIIVRSHIALSGHRGVSSYTTHLFHVHFNTVVVPCHGDSAPKRCDSTALTNNINTFLGMNKNCMVPAIFKLCNTSYIKHYLSTYVFS